MSAFIEATCPKCNVGIGWRGTMANRPACYRCGHRPDQATLDAAEAEMQAARDLVDAHPRDATADMRRQQRIAAGLTLRRAAGLLGVTGKELSDVENGRTEPTAELLDKMAKVYDVGPVENEGSK